MANLIGILSRLAWDLAGLALAVAGLLAIVGAKSWRDRCLRAAAGLAFLGLLLPYSFASASAWALSINPELPDISADLPTAATVIVGHLALAAFLLWRRLGGAERAGREAGEAERVRSRERQRLPLDGGGR